MVAGGCGFIGSHLTEALIEHGCEVTVFDKVPPPRDQRLARQQARFVRGDVRDAGALARAIRPGVDVVYHLASMVGVDQYLTQPADVIDVTFSGTKHVLDLALRADAKVVLASTSEVFGKNPEVPWNEEADRVLGATSADRWVYSASKGIAEHLAFSFARQRGLAVTIIRYFNVYGPRQRPAFVVSRSVHRVLNGVPPVLYDGGRQTRCFTYVADAIDGTLKAAMHPAAQGQAFNVGNSTETHIADVISLVAELVDPGIAVLRVNTAEALGSSYEDLLRRVPDSTKARDVLGWSADTSLRAGLSATIGWARDNPWWLALPDSGAAV